MVKHKKLSKWNLFLAYFVCVDRQEKEAQLQKKITIDATEQNNLLFFFVF